jgi:hypothetical protein
MLVALSAIASEQGAPRESTLQKVYQFLDYAATHPDAVVTYRASDMILAIHSDASYLSKPKARSRARGHYFMSTNAQVPPNNGAVLNVAQIIKAVMSSAAEAELGALFINAKTAVPMQKALEELGHPQPQTPIQTDNSTAHGLINNKIQPKATKAMDMRFYWLRPRKCRAIQVSLGAGQRKPCGLLDKAPSATPSPTNAPNNFKQPKNSQAIKHEAEAMTAKAA